jgi:hypothetical protein
LNDGLTNNDFALINRINVIGLGQTHSILTEHKQIKAVSFIIDKRDYTKLLGKGGRKQGAVRVEPGDVVARITCTDESEYHVRATVRGQLVEVNEQLLSNPHLLTTNSAALRGWVLMVLATDTASNSATTASRSSSTTTSASSSSNVDTNTSDSIC